MEAKDVSTFATLAIDLLAQVDGKLSGVAALFRTLTAHTDNQGQVCVSATLYKMVQDIDHLRTVAPVVVQKILDDTKAVK